MNVPGAVSAHDDREPSPESERARILGGLVELVAERGLGGVSVEKVIARAEVSTDAFHAHFDTVEDGVLVVIDDTLRHVSWLVSDAFAVDGSWHTRARGALGAVLAYFDREPAIARLCLVETLTGSQTLLEHREGAIASFRSFVVDRLAEENLQPSSLAAEGGLASVMGIVYARVIAREGQPLVGLTDSLMALLTASNFADQDPPARFVTARARRARECLRCLAEQPGLSNRELAARIGVAHESQMSRLLSGLVDRGLLAKRSEGVGKRNAWRLTPLGERLVRDFEVQAQPADLPGALATMSER
jgi:AcrR family transcriptional regulator